MVHLIVVLGRRWFDKKNGNTYNTVHLIVHGEQDGKRYTTEKHLGFEYGYGDHYVDRAADCLVETGYVDLKRYTNGAREPLWSYCADLGIKLVRSVVDVAKKGDL